MYESDRVFLSYRDADYIVNEYELDITRGLNKTIQYTLFKFSQNDGIELPFYTYLRVNRKETVYDVHIFVKDENDEIIYEGDIHSQITVEALTQSSGSDGYIAGARVYLNSYANNEITRFSDTLFTTTDSVGTLQPFNYYDGPDYENETYLLSVEGGTDIATEIRNIFTMYKPLTNAPEFKVTYLTTLQSYYIAYRGLTTEEAETKVLTLFKLDSYSNIDINTYDPIYDLIKETNGSADAYRENTYLSILVSEIINYHLIWASTLQPALMFTILEKLEELQPNTFKDITFISTIINLSGFSNTFSNNLITNLNNLFTIIEGFTTTGVELATEITKAKSAAYELSLLASTVDIDVINEGIQTAEIGVLEQPTITDPSNVSIETNESITIINTVKYESSVVPSDALLRLPSYYDDYVNSITIGNDTTNSILTIYYNESTRAIEQRLENVTDTLTVDDVIEVDLVINTTITITTQFILTIVQANRVPNLLSTDVSSVNVFFMNNISHPQSISVTDYFEDADRDVLVWTSNSATLITIDYDSDLSDWTSYRNDETYTTIYTNNYTAFDGKGESSEYVTITVEIQDALTVPTIPQDTTLFVSEIGTLTSSVNKSSATLSITDTNIMMNGNALAFRTTATLVEGVHTLVVNAKNIYNGVTELTESDPFVITTILKVTQINTKEIINSRGTAVLNYADLFNS